MVLPSLQPERERWHKEESRGRDRPTQTLPPTALLDLTPQPVQHEPELQVISVAHQRPYLSTLDTQRPSYHKSALGGEVSPTLSPNPRSA